MKDNKIAEWLLAEYSIQADASTVSRRLRRMKEEKQAATQLAYAKAAYESAVNELAIIDDVINRFHRKIVVKLEVDDISSATSLANAMQKYLAMHVEMSGAATKEKEVNDVVELSVILENIKTLAN